MVRLGLLFVCVGFLIGCDQASNRVSTLWTNVPEVAAYVERFNAAQRDWQILVEFQDDPASLLLTPGRKADLVIARGLASTEVRDSMVPLDFLFDNGSLSKAAFYRGITDAGQQGDQFKLLPVSFDLPVLLYSKKTFPSLPGYSLDLGTVKQLGADFAPTDERVPKKLAFSPAWEGFGVTFLQLKGVDFREGFQGTLTWDSGRLTQAVAEFRSWPSPGPEATAEFRRKYLQVDPTTPLAAGRLQFYPSTLATFEARPWDERRDLDFRFVDEGGRVAAADSIVWAGIPSSSLTRGAGEHFLGWLFRADVQQTLIRQARIDDDRSFGLARGLSSLIRSNETTLVETFPEMAGRLPEPNRLWFWNDLPPDWRTVVKTAVVRPWLETGDGTEASLRQALDKRRAQAAHP